MTTKDAAAARRQLHLVALAVVMSLTGFGLAGCGGSLFDSASNTTQEPTPAPTVAQARSRRSRSTLSSDLRMHLGKQLHQEFASALERTAHRCGRARTSAPIINLRPYILAAKEKAGTKVSYVLDVTDPTGKRVNRFAGEEVVASSASQDSWAAITPAVAADHCQQGHWRRSYPGCRGTACDCFKYTCTQGAAGRRRR